MSTQAEVAAPPADPAAQSYNTWQAILGYLGPSNPSCDGRVLDPAGLTVRPLPLTLLFMPATGEGHDGAYPVGSITRVWTDGEKLMGEGTCDSSPQAQDAFRMVNDGIQREVSVDTAVKKYAMRFPLDMDEQVVVDADGGESIEIIESADDYLMTFLEWELCGATICSGAAFSGTEITVTADGNGLRTPMLFNESAVVVNTTFAEADETPADEGAEEGETATVVGMIAFFPLPEEATALARQSDTAELAADIHLTLSVFTDAAPPDPAGLDALLTEFAGVQAPLAGDVTGVGVFSPGDVGVPIVCLADVYGLNDLRADLCEALDAAGYPYATDHDFVPHLTLDYLPAPQSVASDDPALGQALTFGAVSFVTMDGTRTDYALTGTWEEDDAAPVTAAAAGLAPVAPPVEWFADPNFDEPTPLTITPEGRVYGHFAPFGVCHIARGGACLDARSLTSESGYAYFNTGALTCAGGETVYVGRLTMDTGHANIRYSAGDAAAHYDDTATAWAHVRAGHDRFGQWITGALAPDVSAEKARCAAAAALSGDWRPINGRNELVAVLSVNVPGFPLPRPEVEYAVAASGKVEVVAAFGIAAGRTGTPLVTDEVRLCTLRASLDGLDALKALIPAA